MGVISLPTIDNSQFSQGLLLELAKGLALGAQVGTAGVVQGGVFQAASHFGELAVNLVVAQIFHDACARGGAFELRFRVRHGVRVNQKFCD